MRRRYEVAWYLWVAGTIVIVLSWVNLVSAEVGWVGFGVALCGTLLSAWGRRRSEFDRLTPGTRRYIETHLNDLRVDATSVSPSTPPDAAEGETGAEGPPPAAGSPSPSSGEAGKAGEN